MNGSKSNILFARFAFVWTTINDQIIIIGSLTWMVITNTHNSSELNLNYVVRKLRLDSAIIDQKFGAHLAHSLLHHIAIEIN